MDKLKNDIINLCMDMGVILLLMLGAQLPKAFENNLSKTILQLWA